MNCTARALVIALVTLGVAACGGSDGPFRPCIADPDCSGGRQCFVVESGASICMLPCDADTATCDDGEACAATRTDPNVWACLPGGEERLGDVCTRSLDCELGAVCVSEGIASLCRAICDPRTPLCGAGLTCVATSAERGYCAANTGVNDMGVASGDGGT